MTTRELIRSRLVGAAWIRQQLMISTPECAEELSVLLGAADNRQRLINTLCSAQTYQWMDTMVRLIDRSAPALLPDGQFAAHAAEVVNLTAGLKDSDIVDVRFNERGNADLPAIGLRVSGGFEAAGLDMAVDLGNPDPGLSISTLADAPKQAVVESTAFAAAQPAGPMEPPDILQIIERWQSEGRRLGEVAISVDSVAVGEELAGLLDAAGVPTSIEPNYATTQSIREDNTFDHLSLLSVRDPGAFEQIALAAAGDRSRLGRRMSGHCAYIMRRYAEAAESYAELLLDDVADLDLWRDFCWALRHDGVEVPTRCWVMHPLEVIAVARQVDLNQRAGSSRERIEGFLKWVSDDLG